MATFLTLEFVTVIVHERKPILLVLGSLRTSSTGNPGDPSQRVRGPSLLGFYIRSAEWGPSRTCCDVRKTYTNAKGLKGLDGAANHRIANQAWCVVPLLVFEEEHKTYDRDMGDASQRRSARSRVETAIGAACATTSWCLKWRTSPSPPLHPSLGTPLFDPDSLGSLCPIEREISSGVLPAARSTQWGKQPSTKKRTPGQLFPPPSNLCDRVLFCRF